MVLVRWDPWQDMLATHSDTQHFLRRFLGEWPTGMLGGSQSFVPPVEVVTRDEDLVVRAELPGIDPEQDVDITVHDGVLEIRGERRREENTNGNAYFRQETVYGAFRRRIALPESVDPDQIKATYQQGILEVVIPKAVTLPEVKRIPVQSGERRAITADAKGD